MAQFGYFLVFLQAELQQLIDSTEVFSVLISVKVWIAPCFECSTAFIGQFPVLLKVR